MKATNKTVTKVFMANGKFFNQKVQNFFKSGENKSRKFSPVYNGRYLEVWIELYDGKYYLSFKELGNALGDYSKRIRKTMTMRQIDTFISEYYDNLDEMDRKCVEVYNAAMNPKKGAKSEPTKEDAPKEDTKRNLSEKVLNGKQGKQFAYILDAIANSTSATDNNKEFATDYGKIAFFFEYFEEEFNYPYNKKLYPNLQKRIEQYLRGLPSCINIAYMDYRIIEIGKEWGYCQTEKKAYKFADDWWGMIARRLIQIAIKLGYTL